MQRALLVALVLAAVAAGQGVEEWIETALDVRVAPQRRIDALKRVAQTKDGLDKLAERGLKAERDPEIVHPVVDTLLGAADYRPYVLPMCKLLLVEKHQSNVLRRFQEVGEHPEKGLPLLDGCGAIAREAADPALRVAAIRALGRIPRRAAVDLIVEVGLGSGDEQVRAAAREYVARWLGASTLREAAEILKARRLDTFWDLVEARLDDFLAQEREHEERMRRFFEKASASEALEELERGGHARPFAAQRLKVVAEEWAAGKNGIAEPTEFARRVFEGLVAELARETPNFKVLAQLVGALQPFARDAKGPLLKVKRPEDVLATIRDLAGLPGSGREHQDMGSAAVRLLGGIDDVGLALNAFAEKFPSVDVRKEAIQQLGQLALRVEEKRGWVAIKLAELLARWEKEAPVRAQILSLMTQEHVPVAGNPDIVKLVGAYLDPAATAELSDPELRDCAVLLGKRRTPEAKEVLRKAAAAHPRLQVRRYAVEEGLLPWARTDETIHEDLKALVLADQPIEARRAVIEALGKRGGRRAAVTLKDLSESKDLAPELLPAVREAKLQLAKRLASDEAVGPGDAAEQKAGDLDTACRLLEQEIGGDPERLEKLADQVVRAADMAKAPACTARYRLAWLYARLPAEKTKESELLRRYEEAAANAASDKLPGSLREAMLLEYREVLLRTDEPARVERAVTCIEDLAELALEEKDAVKGARYYLEATDCAVKLGSRSLAEDLLQKAKLTGGVSGDLVAREQDLRGRVEALPRPG